MYKQNERHIKNKNESRGDRRRFLYFIFYFLFICEMTIYGHRHSHHADTQVSPPLDKAPRVPKNITQSRINNFLSEGGQFYGMGIQRFLWIKRHSGAPHVVLKVYSVPDLKV